MKQNETINTLSKTTHDIETLNGVKYDLIIVHASLWDIILIVLISHSHIPTIYFVRDF